MGYHDLTETVKLSPPVDTSQPYDPDRVAEKTILVTGGALGLGAAFTRHWAAHGAHMIIGDINDDAGEALVAELRTKHPKGSHHYFHCDVTDWDSQVSLFKNAARVSPHGGIDVVVANAGVNIPAANSGFENPSASPSDPDAPSKPNNQIIDINVTAAMHTAHLALFWLARNGPNKLNPSRDSSKTRSSQENGGQRDRCLLLLGSAAGLFAFAGQIQYTISKHAITGLFRALRGSAWIHGVRTTMLCPYFISGTKMFPAVAEAIFLAGGPGGAALEDVIDAATRLVADDSIVGRALAIGGPLKGVSRSSEGEEDEQATGVWDCYAEDYTGAETFVWRWIRLVNAVEKARGVLGILSDVWTIFWRK